MARSSECTDYYAQKVLDGVGIVRDAPLSNTFRSEQSSFPADSVFNDSHGDPGRPLCCGSEPATPDHDSVERSYRAELGTNQRLTATYVGADARRLVREDRIAPEGLFNGPSYPAVTNGGYAHYEAVQVQFQRRMSHGLQALVSYNFSNASDTGSNDGTGFAVPSVSQIVVPPLTPSDFDLRHSVAGAVSYEVAAPAWGRTSNAILKGWAVDGLVRVNSAPPLTVVVGNQNSVIGYHQVLANVVPGQPF